MDRTYRSLSLTLVLFILPLILMPFSCSNDKRSQSAGSDKNEYLATIETGIKEHRSFSGERLAIVLQVENIGKKSWSSRGKNPCFLSYHLLDEKGEILRFDNPRTALPRTIKPGDRVEIIAKIKIPLEKGTYALEFDLVREGVAWLRDSGSKTLLITLQVDEKSWPEDEHPLDLNYGKFTKLSSGVSLFEKLVKLIRVTLSHNEIEFIGKTGRVRGFAAGSGYPQVWLRDSATIIPASRYYYPGNFLVSWLEEHLACQKEDGSLADWIDSRGRSDKNTVESDQESSAVQSAYQIFLLLGHGWLKKEILGVSIIRRLEEALLYLFRDRSSNAFGMIRGAHTADWGDVDIEDADQRAIYVDEKTHWTVDVYDQSMAFQACQNLAQMFSALGDTQRDSFWRSKAESLKGSTDRALWQEDKGFYRVHRHLDRLSHDFDEDDIFAMGGNVQAILSGLADAGQARRIILQALERQKKGNISTISGVLYPPYPAGFFKHPAMDEMYEYQNGGQWDWFGGRLISAMFDRGFSSLAKKNLLEIIRKNISNGGLFEWDTREGDGRGSDDYSGSAGSLALALFEGYLGIKVREESLLLEPKLGEDKTKLHAYIPAADIFVAYDYDPDRLRRRIIFRYNSNSPHPGKIKMLIPRMFFESSEEVGGEKKIEILRDGRKIPFQMTHLNEDDYAVFETDFKDHTVEIKTIIGQQ